MPVTKSAKKALRRDRRRTETNKLIRQQLKKTIAKTKRLKSAKTLLEAYRIIDRAAKKGVIHKNKAARLKHRLTQAVKTKRKA